MGSEDAAFLCLSMSSRDYSEDVSVLFIVSLVEPVKEFYLVIHIETIKPLTVIWENLYSRYIVLDLGDLADEFDLSRFHG